MKVFVYGTLMEGFPNYNYYLSGNITSLQKGKTAGHLYHLPQDYPAMLEGNGTVHGEIVELMDKDDIHRLDSLEGYRGEGEGNLYRRVEREVTISDGNKVNCHLYIYENEDYAKEHGTFIPSGNWREFYKEEEI